MRLLLTLTATTLALVSCGQAAPASPPAATLAPAPTVTTAPTTAPTPTTVAISPLPTSVKPPTAAQRAAFIDQLRAIDPKLVADDADQRVAEGLDLCVHIAQGEQGREIVLAAAISFDVELGEAAKVATAATKTLCP